VEGAVSSPEWIVVSLGWCLGLVAWVTGGNERFHVQKFWWVQDSTGAFRTCSAVPCIDFYLLFGEKGETKRKKKEEKNETILAAGYSTWDSGAVLCYKKLI
jgi:hypothetical protein